MKFYYIKKPILLIVCLLLCNLSTVLCQVYTNTDSTTLYLSVKEAKEYAVEHNRKLQNSSLEIKKAERVRWQTLASMLPQVNATGNYQNLCGYEMNFGDMVIPMNPSGTFSITASISLSGSQIVGTFLQNIAVDMSDINKEKTTLDIISNIEKTYYSALVMKKTIELLDDSKTNMEKLLDITQNSVNVGVAEQTDADKISVQLSVIKNNISNSKRQLDMIYSSLLLQLGAPISDIIVLTDNLDNLIDEDITNNLITQQFDINNNVDYRLLTKNMDLSKRRITLNIMNFLPSISTFYQFSKKTYFDKSEFMNMTPPNLVGININIPIWSSGVNTTKVQESKLDYQILENNLIETKNSLLIQDKQLRNNLITAFENYQTQMQNIEVSERVFNNISNKYEYGRASSLDVTNASNQLVTAQNNYIQSVLSLINAQLELKKLLNITE